jgi:hypothetical protein
MSYWRSWHLLQRREMPFMPWERRTGPCSERLLWSALFGCFGPLAAGHSSQSGHSVPQSLRANFQRREEYLSIEGQGIAMCWRSLHVHNNLCRLYQHIPNETTVTRIADFKIHDAIAFKRALAPGGQPRHEQPLGVEFKALASRFGTGLEGHLAGQELTLILPKAAEQECPCRRELLLRRVNREIVELARQPHRKPSLGRLGHDPSVRIQGPRVLSMDTRVGALLCGRKTRSYQQQCNRYLTWDRHEHLG